MECHQGRASRCVVEEEVEPQSAPALVEEVRCPPLLVTVKILAAQLVQIHMSCAGIHTRANKIFNTSHTCKNTMSVAIS